MVALTVLVAVVVAAGPTVARIRALATDVRTSAASRYTKPVPAIGADEITLLARAFNDAGTDVRAHLEQVEFAAWGRACLVTRNAAPGATFRGARCDAL